MEPEEDPFLTPDPPPETATTAAIIETGPAGKTPRPSAFIGYLLGKAQQDSPKDADRQALAELRGILRGSPGDYLRAARHVAPFLGDRASNDDRWFYLVGGLLALHPRHIRPNTGERVGPSLGVALGKLRTEASGGSADSRFLALLNTPAPALGKALRQSVALLAQAGVGLDYTRLLYDLTRWEDPERRVQKQWARDYFRADFSKAGASGATTAIPDDNDSTDDESETE
jgi:CRISPR system Cascade subunit CasB